MATLLVSLPLSAQRPGPPLPLGNHSNNSISLWPPTQTPMQLADELTRNALARARIAVLGALSEARLSMDALHALAAAGLTPGAILALSQTVAFVSYQLRLVALLRALGLSTADAVVVFVI